jgi:hypothetical protein
MPRFLPNQTVETSLPVVTVDAGLRPGRHRFRLVVVDDLGNRSEPDEIVVTVAPSPHPPINRPPTGRPVSPPGRPDRPGGRRPPK